MSSFALVKDREEGWGDGLV